MKPIQYQRKIIEVEKRLGFMYVPAKAQHLMPDENTKIEVHFEGTRKAKSLSYNADYNRIFRLTSWYKKNRIEVDDLLTIHASLGRIRIYLPSPPQQTPS